MSNKIGILIAGLLIILIGTVWYIYRVQELEKQIAAYEFKVHGCKLFVSYLDDVMSKKRRKDMAELNENFKAAKFCFIRSLLKPTDLKYYPAASRLFSDQGFNVSKPQLENLATNKPKFTFW